jgi:5-methylcytosine-specific restriction endonuclease McrA
VLGYLMTNDETFARYRGYCILCWENADHCHHLKPIGACGEDTEDNKVTLCNDCHTMVHHVGPELMEEMLRDKARKLEATFKD